MNKRGRLIVLSGPSGVGKGTVLARYREEHPGVRLSISATTRAPRPGEADGEHYFFLSREQFEERIARGGMLEWAQYNNNYYGTPRDYVERALEAGEDVVLEIEVQGAMKVREQLPEALLVFVMPPSFGELRRRLCERGTEDPETIRGRLCAAARELAHAHEYDYIVINDTVESAASTLSRVLDGARDLVKYNLNFISEVLQDAQTSDVAD